MAEAFPVSSSAQLSLLPWLLRQPAADDRTSLAGGLHAGSCLGTAVALRADLRWRELPLLAVATVPAAVAGVLAGDVVERRFGRPGPTAALLAAAGVALLLADRRPEQRPANDRDLLLAGLAQVVALVPGVSRSGATLTVLRARGVDRSSAYRTSMLLSLPVTAGAALRSSLPEPQAITSAALSGLLATRLARRDLHTSFTGSGAYRLALAALVARRLVEERS